VYRYRTGVAWRDLPARFGPWRTVWKRHARFSRDGTWDRILTTLQARADARGDVDWQVSVDSTVNRAHQHGATLPGTQGQGRITRIRNGPSLTTTPGAGHGAVVDEGPRRGRRAGRPLAVLVSPGQGGDAPM
jgi:transposase